MRKVLDFVINAIYTHPLVAIYGVSSFILCIWLLATPVDMELYSVITKTWATAALVLIALEARNHYLYEADIDEEEDNEAYEEDKCA